MMTDSKIQAAPWFTIEKLLDCPVNSGLDEFKFILNVDPFIGYAYSYIDLDPDKLLGECSEISFNIKCFQETTASELTEIEKIAGEILLYLLNFDIEEESDVFKSC